MRMSDAEQREIAENLFERRGQGRQEIKDAFKLEDERRAALVKNLYRLRALLVTTPIARKSTVTIRERATARARDVFTRSANACIA
jgi:hypothetical protein